MKAGLAVAAVAATVLLRFPPERYAFYPRCPFFEAFGLLCPGCGSTRAAAALLHGRVLDALHWNGLFVAFFFVSIPYALVGRGRHVWVQPPARMVAFCIAVATAFGIARNF